jgi:hypothetical protein
MKRISTERELKKYVPGCLSEAKTFEKLNRERRIKDRKVYKGKRLRAKIERN